MTQQNIAYNWNVIHKSTLTHTLLLVVLRPSLPPHRPTSPKPSLPRPTLLRPSLPTPVGVAHACSLRSSVMTLRRFDVQANIVFLCASAVQSQLSSDAFCCCWRLTLRRPQFHCRFILHNVSRTAADTVTDRRQKIRGRGTICRSNFDSGTLHLNILSDYWSRFCSVEVAARCEFSFKLRRL